MGLGQPLKTSPPAPPAIALLKDKDPGAFLIRDSHSFQGAYGLALKVATPPPSAQPWKGTECPNLRERGRGVGQLHRQDKEVGHATWWGAMEVTLLLRKESQQGRRREPGI